MSIYKKDNQLAFFNANTFLPRHLFTIFALGGSILLLLLKIEGVPQYITVLIPIICIVCYCNIPSKYPLFLMTEDRIGDNAYYLGFLYTLTSLSYALWVFASGENSPESIIRSFGIALSSTIIGVIARVYYSSLKQDPEDIEKDARLKISAAANTLTVELYQASNAFNIYRRSLQQSMEEAFINMNEKVGQAISDNATAMKQDLGKASVDIVRVYSEINSSSSMLSESIKTSVQAINKVNTRVEKSFSTLNESAGALDNIIKQQVQSVNGISTVVENFMKMSQSIHQLIKNTDEQVSHLGQSSQSVNGLTVKMNLNLVTFSEALSELASKQKNVVDAISQHANELKLQLDNSRKYTEETHSSLAEMTRTLADKLQ